MCNGKNGEGESNSNEGCFYLFEFHSKFLVILVVEEKNIIGIRMLNA